MILCDRHHGTDLDFLWFSGSNTNGLALEKNNQHTDIFFTIPLISWDEHIISMFTGIYYAELCSK